MVADGRLSTTCGAVFMDLFISDKCTKINTKKCEKFFKNILQD